MLVIDIHVVRVPLDSCTIELPPLGGKVERLRLAVPSSLDQSQISVQEETRRWLVAFRKSLQYTIRTISNPLGARFIDTSLQNETQKMNRSILACGLPIPKSPSLQFEDPKTGADDSKRQEQEERGWWSVRFQQVLAELLREMPLKADETCM